MGNLINAKEIEKNDSTKEIDTKKENLKKWSRNTYNLLFIIVLIFTICLRLYYFWLTKNQPLWWDESEYMAQAKAIAGLVNYDSVAIRSPIFPGVMSLFFFLGLDSEVTMRFFALFLPSILTIILTYFLLKQMYNNRKIALISTLIMGVLWEHLFYSNRFHTENFALIFEFISLLVLYKVYLKKEDWFFIKPKYSLLYVLLFAIISFLFRPGNIMFLPPLLLFLVMINKRIVTTRKGILSIVLGCLALFALFIFTNIPQSFLNQYLHLDSPIGWRSLTVFYGFYQSFIRNIPSIFFYVFILGLVSVGFKTLLVFDKVKFLEANSEDLEFKSNLFNILLLFGVLFVFVFIMRATLFEYRWFFPLLPAMLAFTSKGILNIGEYCGNLLNNKAVMALIIIILCLIGVYTQVNHATQIIKLKVDSYSQVRDAAILLKQNFDKEEQILTISYPQTVYYSEMNVFSYSEIENEELFDQYLQTNRPRFLEVSGFENHPAWLNNWLTTNQERIKPIKVYFLDTTQEQPLLVIYEISY